MIRVEAFVDDKKVAQVLHALDGLVIQLAVVPVRNAKVKGGKITSAGEPVTAREVIQKLITQKVLAKQNTITSNELYETAASYNITKEAIRNIVYYMRKSKQLKSGKKPGTYTINVSKQGA